MIVEMHGENDVSKIDTCSADADDGCMMLLSMYVCHIRYIIFCFQKLLPVIYFAVYYVLLVEHNLLYSKLYWHNLESLSRRTISLRITFAPRGFGTTGDMCGTLRVPYHLYACVTFGSQGFGTPGNIIIVLAE